MGFLKGKAIEPLSYGRSKFQNKNFSNLIADLNSSQKSMNVKCLPFYDIQIGSAPKIQAKPEKLPN